MKTLNILVIVIIILIIAIVTVTMFQEELKLSCYEYIYKDIKCEKYGGNIVGNHISNCDDGNEYYNVEGLQKVKIECRSNDS